MRRESKQPFAKLLFMLSMVGVVGFSVSAQDEAAPEPAEAPPVITLEPNLGWLNSDEPLAFDDQLQGHVVLLDFWTYCCINCLHVLPDLEYLEEKYKDEPFHVIGVHSAKFTGEGDRESIRHAMARYDIKHPVVIDDRFGIWRKFGARSWPTFVLIGADGRPLGSAAGEGNRDLLDFNIQMALEQAKEGGYLAEEKSQIELGEAMVSATGLTYPGKVLASVEMDRVFIADSAADRVVIATYPDEAGVSELVAVVGSGTRGFEDGVGTASSFNYPQGMTLDADRGLLYIADTKNHVVRSIDLESFAVTTIAGTGEQTYDRRGGGERTAQALSSPWALALSDDGKTLHIAMAGTHQLWQMDMETGVVGASAGSGRENSFDATSAEAALAQPSGLTFSADGTSLYFADSESSSIRAHRLETDTVETVVGHRVEDINENGLFEYGDTDGVFPDARLQHALGVALWNSDEGERLVVADTYNHKIKLVDPATQTSTSWDASLGLNEPGGVFVEGDDLFIADTNNQRVVIADLVTGSSRELSIQGLERGSVVDAIDVTVAADTSGTVTIRASADLPLNAHPNPEAPLTLRVVSNGRVLAQNTGRFDSFPVAVTLDARGAEALDVELSFAWCEDGDLGVCLPGNLAWRVQVEAGEASSFDLSAPVEARSGG